MKHRRILVVDDDESLRRITQLQLEEAGHEVLTASSGDEALKVIEEEAPALVITDFKMPGLSGLEVLKKVRESYPQTTVVMITAFGTVQTAVEAMKAGAYDYITKPIDYEELVLVVNRAMEHYHLLEEVRNLRLNLDQKYGFGEHYRALKGSAQRAGDGLQSCSKGLHRADPRRDGNWEGVAGQGNPPEQPPQGPGLRHYKLWSHPEGPAGIGTFRPRQRLLYRSVLTEARKGRDRRRRHFISG